MKNNLGQNKTRAIDFYKTAYEGNPKLAVEKYVGDEYRKIVEHWDAIQEIPATSANGNTMH